MGLAYIKQRSATSILGLWLMEESLEELYGDWDFTEDQLIDYETRVTEKRKKEWLTTRILLGVLLDEDYSINYTTDGKPFLSPDELNISISHSNDYVVILLDSHKNVGVDIQKIKDTISKAPDYFLQPTEIKRLTQTDNLIELTIYWSAKEAIYKYIGLASTDLKNDVLIKPFRPSGAGIVTALIDHKTNVEEIVLHYTHFDDYIMVTTS